MFIGILSISKRFLFNSHFLVSMGRFSSIVKKFRVLNDGERVNLNSIEGLVSKTRFKLIKSLLKQKKISIEKVKIDSSVIEGIEYPQIKKIANNVDAEDVNKDIKEKAMQGLFEKFSENAFEIISKCIAGNIIGMDSIKKAAALQLFAKQPVHLLLLGDPGTGKTDILRSSFNMSPISSFGLGSGTSGAGLVVSVKGNKIVKGLLSLADNGVCCIDELNLMKEENRAGLYNAMEKGFVTYDKGGNHYKFDAKVRILATANPRGDKFEGTTVSQLKKELPFDSALLTRFHLTFIVKKPDAEKFRKISEKIVSHDKTELSKGDTDFIKSYIEFVRKKDVKDLSKDIQKIVVEFVEEIKKNEKKYLVEISPRLIIGFMRLCKALALIENRDEVDESDIERVKVIVEQSLKI